LNIPQRATTTTTTTAVRNLFYVEVAGHSTVSTSQSQQSLRLFEFATDAHVRLGWPDMKFAREFREALANEGFPARWVQHAVPYGELKKCVKKVRTALRVLVGMGYEI
jgi:hypothetical protein